LAYIKSFALTNKSTGEDFEIALECIKTLPFPDPLDKTESYWHSFNENDRGIIHYLFDTANQIHSRAFNSQAPQVLLAHMTCLAIIDRLARQMKKCV